MCIFHVSDVVVGDVVVGDVVVRGIAPIFWGVCFMRVYNYSHNPYYIYTHREVL